MSKPGKGSASARRPATAALRSRRRGSSPLATSAVVAVVLFAAVVGVGIYFAQRPADVVVPPNATAQGVVVGQPDAPVRIDLYVDFQCPACRQFEQRVGPTIDELVKSGTAKVAYHPVAFLDRFSSTRYSSRAAAASGCAAAAGVFPRFAELLFAHQPPEGGDGLSDQRLIELGRQAGATGEDFATCVRQERYAGWVAHITETASRRGVNATPTVLVNGEQLPRLTAQALREAVAQAS